MSSISKHTAAGQLAGYLFQPERALYHLAKSPRGSVVGIETLDDVAVLFPDGSVIYEQDKHSVQKQSPLAEKKIALWKTFDIWSQAIVKDEIDIARTEFHLVTNRAVTSGLCIDLLKSDKSPASVRQIVNSLREAGKKTSKAVRVYSDAVLQQSDEVLATLLGRVRVIDGTQNSAGDGLKKVLAETLPLPEGKEEIVLQSLLGWVHDTVVALIRQGEPAWLSKEAFVTRYIGLVGALHDKRFLNETAEALIPITSEKRGEHRHRLFVKQLLWLGLPENDESLLDAIDDFIRSKTERIRLAKSGVASLADYEVFQARLTSRWKIIFKKSGISTDEEDCQKRGRATLHETLNHREALAGYETQEYYLTRGAYHQLADEPSSKPRIGWHPKFQEKCSNYSNNESHQ